jgi:DNA-binding GntR family transcriptional regulator
MARDSVNSLKAKIYNDLKEKIIFSDILPGSTIVEADLCEQYKVSRTPVREALLELEKEGFVDIQPRKSTRVSRIAIKEINDIIKIRLIVEVQVVRMQAEPLSPEQIGRFQEVRSRFDHLVDTDASNLKEFLRLDYEFHRSLIELCDNELLLRIYLTLLQKSVRQWYFMCIHVEKRLADSIREHAEVIDNMLKGNFEAAALKLEEHIKTYYDMMYFC